MAGEPPLLDASDLGDKTKSYWRLDPKKYHRTPDEYVERLLPLELRFAQQQPGALPADRNCDILVLTVGYSFEPLLQSVCVYNPAYYILLIFNKDYGDTPGEEYSGTMQGWIEETLRSNTWIDQTWLTNQPKIECKMLPDENPLSIFRILHDELARLRPIVADQLAKRRRPPADTVPEPRVIIDITGGKKNMDSGAFLYAAYTNVSVSYVNFEKYEPDNRRPYGYTCRIGILDNPYESFRLRDWEELRGHYENYRFRAALTTLRRIAQPMVDAFRTPVGVAPRPPTPRLVLESLTKLENALLFYLAWDDGEYVLAHELHKKLSKDFHAPEAVKLLGPEWQRLREHTEILEPVLLEKDYWPKLKALAAEYIPVFKSNKLLLAYAADELARIKRLRQYRGDHRSALLRAAGLDEFLLKARMVRLWNRGLADICEYDRDSYRENPTLQNVPDTLKESVERQLAAHDGARQIRWALSCDPELNRKTGRPTGRLSYVPVDIQMSDGTQAYRIRPATARGAPKLAYEDTLGLQGESITQLRNEASHAYLYISPRHSRAALDLAQANIAELRMPPWATLGDDPVPVLTPADVSCAPWDKLLIDCGLTFLPPIPTHPVPTKEGA